ncbi:MAG: DNA primase [Microbacteriaceae bacterium]|nr:DNA primase [Microbacteriaceae bacterium]
MSGRIRASDVEAIKTRTNIQDVVGEYVQLKQSGSGSLVGLSPFKDERTPSFYVRPALGVYHCFSTSQGGDVIDFLQKMENISFTEAVERLAARIGYEIVYEENAKDQAERGQRSRLLEANKLAESFYKMQLLTPEAKHGREFLISRGFDSAAAAQFGVGYAPDSFDALRKHLVAKGFKLEELITAGLVVASDRGGYDRFRNRLVWPIRDLTGQTLGFGARKLVETDNGPKYLNTPDTPIYHKNRVLYGIDLARKSIGSNRQVVVVEGYTDVMAAHLAGVDTAVATCGTAFGSEHVTLIRRVMGDTAKSAGEVIFTFDPDMAGKQAAIRAFAEESRFAAETYVAVAEDGLDPADLRQQKGDDAIRAMIENKKPMVEFMIRSTIEGFNLDTVEGQYGALRQSAPLLRSIRDSALRPEYVRKLAGWLGLDPKVVQREVESASEASSKARDPRNISTEENTTSAEMLPKVSLKELEPLERSVLQSLIQQPAVISSDLVTRIAIIELRNPTVNELKDHLVVQYFEAVESLTSATWLSKITTSLDQQKRELVQQLAAYPLPIDEKVSEDQIRRYCTGVLKALIERDMVSIKARLLAALQRAEVGSEEYRQIQHNLMTLEQERRELVER